MRSRRVKRTVSTSPSSSRQGETAQTPRQCLRDGDSFWYQRQFSGTAIRVLERTTLSDIIARNTSVTNLQDSAFFFKASVSGKVFNDANGNGTQNRGEDGIRGRTVILFNTTEEDEGEEIARTTTDSQGRYRFDNFDGLLVGTYRVEVVVPSGWRATTPADLDFASTKGDMDRNVNFGLNRSGFGSSRLAGTDGGAGRSAAFLAPEASSSTTANRPDAQTTPATRSPMTAATGTTRNTEPPASDATVLRIVEPTTSVPLDLFALDKFFL